MLIEKLMAAVAERKVVAFDIRGKHCTAEPYAVGVGHDGKVRFSAYQLSGPTLVPAFYWMYESVLSLSALALTEESFEPRAGHDALDTRFMNFYESI